MSLAYRGVVNLPATLRRPPKDMDSSAASARPQALTAICPKMMAKGVTAHSPQLCKPAASGKSARHGTSEVNPADVVAEQPIRKTADNHTNKRLCSSQVTGSYGKFEMLDGLASFACLWSIRRYRWLCKSATAAQDRRNWKSRVVRIDRRAWIIAGISSDPDLMLSTLPDCQPNLAIEEFEHACGLTDCVSFRHWC